MYAITFYIQKDSFRMYTIYILCSKILLFIIKELIEYMNNLSEKLILSIEDIISDPLLKQPLDLDEMKTEIQFIEIQHNLNDNPILLSTEYQNCPDEPTTIPTDIHIHKQSHALKQIGLPSNCQLKYLDSDSVYFEGNILRKEQSFISSWEKRYIVLTCGKLFFFQDNSKTRLMGCIYIKYLPVSLIVSQNSFEITCNGDGQNILLKGMDKIQTERWKFKINDVIQHCKDQRKVQIRKFNRSIYQQKDFILEDEFIRSAQTGDLLLISSDNSVAYLQKFFTHSQFNHIAMIFKFQDQIKIFQANQDDGVSIYDWKQYIQTFKDHKRFAWRRLNSQKKAQCDQKLKQLVKKYIGRCYNLSSAKLLRRTSNQQQQKQDRDFFCSEIVAKLYKSISLLDRDISSVRYWPITFTSRGQLNLKDGAYLSTQKNILLARHLKL